jgi:hypothetical protein
MEPRIEHVTISELPIPQCEQLVAAQSSFPSIGAKSN